MLSVKKKYHVQRVFITVISWLYKRRFILTGPDEYTMWLERAETGENIDELLKKHHELISHIRRIDPATLAEQCDGNYVSEGTPKVMVQFLYSWFSLDIGPYRIRAGHEELDTLPLKALALQHLLSASQNKGTAVRVMGQWIDCRSLHDGAFLGAHFSKNTTQLLNRYFHMSWEEKLQRAMAFGGKEIDLGDEAYVFNIFPMLPVALVHWREDLEFPSYNKILYDVSASNFMPTHGIVTLTDFLLHRLAE
jgi:hypothetical protein